VEAFLRQQRTEATPLEESALRLRDAVG